MIADMRRKVLSAICCLCCSLSATADDQSIDSFPLNNHNPFLQIYGLPAFQTSVIAAPGGFDFDLRFDVANDADEELSPTEHLIIDGETHTFSLSLRRRVHDRLELGIDVPYVRHTGGFLDSVITDWHDFFGFSNSGREGQNDLLRHSFVSDGVSQVNLDSSVSGIGDVQLSAAIPFRNVTVRTAVKLSTGDPEKLTGSGATDFSLGIYGSRVYTFLERDMSLSGFVGGLVLGDGDVMPELQRSFVPYGGLALRWQATDKFGLGTQLSVQGSYFDTDFDELGGSTLQFGFGADYRAGKARWRLAFAEDIAGGATPDFAIQLSVQYVSGR